MELATLLKSAAASVVAIGGIGGGALTLNHLHEPAGSAAKVRAELMAEIEDAVRTEDFKQFSVEVFYGRYYELLEKRARAEASGNTELVNEYSRQMETLRVKICQVEPEWERC